MIVFSNNFVKSKDETANHIRNELDRIDILVVVAVRKEGSVNWIQTNSLNVPNIICFDSSSALGNKLGGVSVETEKRGDIFSSLLPFSQSKKLNESVEIARTLSDSWGRNNSDGTRFCLLVIINAYITPVSALKNLRAKGFSTLNCMVTNCGAQILNYLLDPMSRPTFGGTTGTKCHTGSVLA
ncbi:Vitamin D3 receptor [Datura stramonium]|uniref:Vitamin D3 receptor n=1 Tax=Datura stramonium TaxID=4076 RepID=A0ABS8V689_DATST|nr:Vitamin D3 receptor [Datura stramonium]